MNFAHFEFARKLGFYNVHNNVIKRSDGDGGGDDDDGDCHSEASKAGKS